LFERIVIDIEKNSVFIKKGLVWPEKSFWHLGYFGEQFCEAILQAILVFYRGCKIMQLILQEFCLHDFYGVIVV